MKKDFIYVLLALIGVFFSSCHEELYTKLGKMYMLNTSSYDTIKIVSEPDTLILTKAENLYDWDAWEFFSYVRGNWEDEGKDYYELFDASVKYHFSFLILQNRQYPVTLSAERYLLDVHNYTLYPQSSGIYYLEITDELLKTLLEE